MAQATYTIIIIVNGKTLEGKSVKWKWGTPSREPQMAAGVAGRHYTEKPEPSAVSVTVLHLGDFDPDEVGGWVNVTLVGQCDNGPRYQVDGAYVTNPIELGDEGAGVSIEFAGPPATKV